MKGKMKNKFWILFLVIGILVTGCRNGKADGYQFMTQEFQDAVSMVTASYFFDAELPTDDPHDGFMGRHYFKLGRDLCGPIAESYAHMLDKGIDGKNAYAFDEELTKLMREFGAYVLPLRIIDGEVEAIYYNPNWQGGEPDSYGNFKGGNGKFWELYQEFARVNGGGVTLKPEEKGLLNLRARASMSGAPGGSYTKLGQFYDYAVKQRGFEVQEFNGVFDFIHGYLFVFAKNPDDVTEDRVFYYVDLPFHTVINEYGRPAALNRDLEKYDEVECYTFSQDSMRSHGLSMPVRFIEQSRAVASMTDIEPLTIPLNKEYAMRHVPKKDGSVGREKNDGYEIVAADIAEPSLRCWLLALGYIQGDYGSCRNTGYAEEYMEMLNNNICVWNDRVTYAPKVGYPYWVTAGNLKPEYAHVVGFYNRCSSEPYPELKGQ